MQEREAWLIGRRCLKHGTLRTRAAPQGSEARLDCRNPPLGTRAAKGSSNSEERLGKGSDSEAAYRQVQGEAMASGGR